MSICRTAVLALAVLAPATGRAWEPLQDQPLAAWALTRVADFSIVNNSLVVAFSDDPTDACRAIVEFAAPRRFQGLLRGSSTGEQRFVGVGPINLGGAGGGAFALLTFAKANNAPVRVEINWDANANCVVSALETCFDAARCGPPPAAPANR